MCSPDSPCLDKLLSARSDQPRKVQAAALGISRGQLMDALAGNISDRVVTAVSALTGRGRSEVLTAASTTRCTVRRPGRSRSAYGAQVARTAKMRGVTLEALMKASGVDRTSFFHGLGVGVRPSEGQVLKVATVLEVDVVELALLAGHVVEVACDETRLRLGLSRDAFARSHGLDARLLFGAKRAVSPSLAHRVAIASGSGPDAAVQASAAARSARTVRCRTELGRIINLYLDSTGSNLASFSARIGVTRQSVTSWVDGLAAPSADGVRRLADTTGIALDTFIEARRIDVAATHARASSAGRELMLARRSAGLTRTDAAAVLGVSLLTLRRAESGRLDTSEISALNVKATSHWGIAG